MEYLTLSRCADWPQFTHEGRGVKCGQGYNLARVQNNRDGTRRVAGDAREGALSSSVLSTLGGHTLILVPNVHFSSCLMKIHC